jgi:hypothetical protein
VQILTFERQYLSEMYVVGLQVCSRSNEDVQLHRLSRESSG